MDKATPRRIANAVKSVVSNRRRTVAYVGGWLGKSNLGDEAIIEAYEALFPQYGFVAFDGGRLASMAGKVASFRAGLLGGGTLIGLKEWLKPVRQFQRICSHLVILGGGVATPAFCGEEGALPEWIPLLRKCELLGVRGPESAQLLAEHGLPNVEVTGDPVLVFADGAVTAPHEPQTLGLNIGFAGGNMWGNEQRVRAEMTILATCARKAGWKVKWFVVWPSDLAITQKTAADSGTAGEINEVYHDPFRYMDMVRPLSVFAGMKLHATALATCAGTPAIMLEYRPKCRDYMSSIGQSHLTFRTDQFTGEQVWEVVQRIDSKRLQAATDLINGIRPLREKQLALAAKAADLFANHLAN